jgi:MOSC domain-containing protein YiiM
MLATVVAVSRSTSHSFSKENKSSIRLVAGLGVEDDAHLGTTVRHLSRIARNPDAPNLRQVHLIHAELHDALSAAGFDVRPGELGENVTTRGIPLLDLPAGTRLRIGSSAIVEVTGLRNPCVQIDRFRPGLLREVAGRDETGAVWRKSGIMSVVVAGGEVTAGDAIDVELPPEPHQPLQVV